ncbi:MAG: tRNA (guanosine(37)-N1)-methyltransferase TrmD [Patescibacteria group bacterium]
MKKSLERKNKMKFDVITIFPEILDSYFSEGIVGRALKNKKIKIKVHNLRDWTTDNHKTVDDSPYGGGAGMVMKVEPIYKALKQVAKKKNKKQKVVLLSAKGKTWNQKKAREYSKLDSIIFVCGRYEGVDERILNFIDEEVSIGDYVLTGGELGVAVMIDSITRLLPGVLGNEESAIAESHSEEGVLEYPQYTRPEILKIGAKKYKVPEVLLKGNHKEINKWREENKKSR